MRNPRALRSLKQIVKVRDAQNAAAELQVRLATVLRDSREQELRKGEDRLRDAEGRWRDVMTGSVALELVSAWSGQIQRERDAVSAAATERAKAQAALDDRSNALRQAQTRTEVAAELHRAEQRRTKRARAEHQLSLASDQFALKGLRS